MNEITAAALEYIKRGIDLQNASTAEFQHAADVLVGMGGEGARPERVLFCSPVTGQIETGQNVWGGSWFDATGFCTYYTATGKPAYHTGCDLNMPNLADSGRPVYAAAPGEVVFAATVTGWQGDVVCIKHTLEDGSFIWTRYAHITRSVQRGQTVARGAVLGTIADYNKDGPKGDHLHYDVAKIDLSLRPGDWPGLDKVGLVRDYADPAAWHRDRSK
jgi:murein DD-endopeptidase MepM/ murein hydrolase activator NlpD